MIIRRETRQNFTEPSEALTFLDLLLVELVKLFDLRRDQLVNPFKLLLLHVIIT